MKATKRARLEAAGWAVGGAREFLALSPDEAEFVELKVKLSQSLREWRTNKRLAQGELARRLQSSQSRVAKMEDADATVSVDLLLRSLLKLGASSRDIARVIA